MNDSERGLSTARFVPVDPLGGDLSKQRRHCLIPGQVGADGPVFRGGA